MIIDSLYLEKYEETAGLLLLWAITFRQSLYSSFI